MFTSDFVFLDLVSGRTSGIYYRENLFHPYKDLRGRHEQGWGSGDGELGVFSVTCSCYKELDGCIWQAMSQK